MQCKLTGSVNTERITAEAEDLAAHGVDGRLWQAFQLADMLAELIDDFLHVLEHPNTMPNQLVALIKLLAELCVPHVRALGALEDVLSLELLDKLVIELQIGR